MSDEIEHTAHTDTETLKLSKSQINMPRMGEDQPEPKVYQEEAPEEKSEPRPRGWLANLIDKVIGRK